jgi:hypothetical protein
MTESQESHLQSILDKARCAVDFKYRKGQEEHKGNVWDRDVLQDAMDEVTDLTVYVYTADYKRRQAISLIENVIIKLNGKPDTEYEKELLVQAVEQLTQKRTTDK